MSGCLKDKEKPFERILEFDGYALGVFLA